MMIYHDLSIRGVKCFDPSYWRQVFSGLVPVASRQGQAEPLCTYMLECCVRPDVEAATILHIASVVSVLLFSFLFWLVVFSSWLLFFCVFCVLCFVGLLACLPDCLLACLRA